MTESIASILVSMRAMMDDFATYLDSIETANACAEPQVVSIDQAAQRLGLSRATIYRIAKQWERDPSQGFPILHPGGKQVARIRVEDLDGWLARQ
jgi:predicted DNA-binding transcriptional regulator AlpA